VAGHPSASLIAASAILVRRPKGELLIDAGFGAGVAAHVGMLPRFVRAPYQVRRTVSEQLDAAGYDRSTHRPSRTVVMSER
jgi:N-acyl homoserine lactone hydrolase